LLEIVRDNILHGLVKVTALLSRSLGEARFQAGVGPLLVA